MEAMRHALPRLQLTVPVPMKTGKVGFMSEMSREFSTSRDEKGNRLTLTILHGGSHTLANSKCVCMYLCCTCVSVNSCVCVFNGECFEAG